MFAFVEFAVGMKMSGGFAFGCVAVNGEDVSQFVPAFGDDDFTGMDVADGSHSPA